MHRGEEKSSARDVIGFCGIDHTLWRVSAALRCRVAVPRLRFARPHGGSGEGGRGKSKEHTTGKGHSAQHAQKGREKNAKESR